MHPNNSDRTADLSACPKYGHHASEQVLFRTDVRSSRVGAVEGELVAVISPATSHWRSLADRLDQQVLAAAQYFPVGLEIP